MTTLTAVFKAQDKLSGALTKAGNEGNKLNKTMERLGKVGKVAIKGIVTAAAAAGTALAAMGKKVLEVGMGFESSMAQVAATMGETVGSDSYNLLADAAKEWGSKTAFTSSEAADALNYLALAGYDAEKAVAALPTVLRLAGAGGMELAAASDLITDSMAALGLEATETNLNTFADQMAKTASTTNTSVAQLGEATLTVGAVAANLKNGTTELNTQLGILANVGIKGAEGGTHLRNILLRLQSPTTKAAKQLDALGVAVYDAEGNMRDTGDIFADLKKGMEGMSQSEIDAVMASIFNKTDLAAANALLNASGDEYARIFEIIEGSGGAAEQMYDTMLDNLTGDKAKFQSALEAIYLEIFDDSNAELRSIVQLGNRYLDRLLQSYKKGGMTGLASELGNVLGDAVTELLNRLPGVFDMGSKIINALLDSLAKNAKAIGKSAVALALKAIGAVSKALPKLLKVTIKLAQGIVQGVFKALPELLGSFSKWLGKAFDGSKIAGALGKVTGTVKDFLAAFSSGKGLIMSIVTALQKNFGVGISTMFAKFVGGIRGAFVNIGTALKGVWETLKGIDWGAIWEGIKSTASALWEALKTTISAALVSAKLWFLSIDWSGIWAKIKSTALTVFDNLKSAVTTALTLIKVWFLSIDWGGIWAKVTATASLLWEKLKATAALAFALVKTWFLSIDWSGIWSTVTSTATGLWEKLKSAATLAFTALKTWFLSINWDGIWTTVANTVTGLWNKLKSVALFAVTALKTWFFSIDWSGIWATVASTAIGLWGKLKSAASAAFALIKTWFATIDWSGIWSTVTATVSTLLEKLKSAALAAFALVKAWFSTIDWSGIWATVSATAITLWNKLLSVVQTAFALIKAWFSTVDWSAVWATITQTAATLWNKLKLAATNAFTMLKVWFLSIDWSGVWATISNTATGLWEKLKTAMSTAITTLKLWFLSVDWSGLWANITSTASTLWSKLKAGISATGDKLKALILGENYEPGVQWTFVGALLWSKIKSGITSTGDRLKALILGEDYTPDASWGTVASTLWTKIKSGITIRGDRLKALVLGEDYTPGASWWAVGALLWSKVKSGITSTGDRLKALLLGDDYTPDASWTSVGTKILDKIKEGIKSAGNWLSTALSGTDEQGNPTGIDFSHIWDGISNTGEALKTKITGMLSLLPGIISGLASTASNFLSSGTFATLGSSIADFISSAITSKSGGLAAKIISAITGLFSDESIWENISVSVTSISTFLSELLVKAINGIGTGVTSLVTALTTLLTSAFSSFSSDSSGQGGGGGFASYLTTIGSNIVNMIASGIRAAITNVTAIVTAVGDLLKSVFTYENMQKVAGLLVNIGSTIMSLITGAFSGEDGEGIDISGLASALGTMIGNAVSGLASLAGAIAQKLVEWFSSGQVFAALWAIAKGLATALWEFVKAFFTALWPGLQALVLGSRPEYVEGADGMLYDKSFIPDDATPVQIPVTPVITAEDGTPDLSSLLNGGTDGTTGTGIDLTIPATVDPQMPDAATFSQQMQDMFNTNLGADSGNAPDVSGVGVQVAVSIGDGVTASQPTLTTTIQTTVTNAVAGCVWNLSSNGTALVTSLANGISGAWQLASTAMNNVTSYIKTAANVSLYMTGRNIVQGLIKGLNSMKERLTTVCTEIGTLVNDTIQKTTQVESPSKFTTWIGEMVGAGLERGLEGSTRDVAFAAAGMADSVNGAFGGLSEPTVTASPFGARSDTDGVSAERHLTIDVRGGGRIEVGGMTRDQAVELITESLLPQLKQALADEIYEGGDDVYEY